MFQAGRVPEDLATDEARTLHLTAAESEALDYVRRALEDDLRFEYMDKSEREASTVRLVCLAHFKRDESHIEDFVAEHGREPMQRTCFFPVVHLTVTEEFELPQGARLIPKADAKVPGRILGPDPRETMASALAVECVGTNYNNMSRRAMATAEHALRALRAGLREERFVPDRQLRFAVGESVWFDDGASGWSQSPALGWDYEPGEAALSRAVSQPIASLPPTGGNEVEECASRALGWWEQAHLAVDPLMEVLFLFFALEAILGTKSGGPKARPLARRRAILAHHTTQHFAHPIRVWGLYTAVRNEAVHGSEAPDVAQDELDAFSWDVRRALNEYVDFARARDLVERDAVLDVLDGDPDGARIEREFLPQR